MSKLFHKDSESKKRRTFCPRIQHQAVQKKMYSDLSLLIFIEFIGGDI